MLLPTLPSWWASREPPVPRQALAFRRVSASPSRSPRVGLLRQAQAPNALPRPSRICARGRTDPSVAFTVLPTPLVGPSTGSREAPQYRCLRRCGGSMLLPCRGQTSRVAVVVDIFLFWILVLTLSMVSELSTSNVMVLPVSVFS